LALGVPQEAIVGHVVVYFELKILLLIVTIGLDGFSGEYVCRKFVNLVILRNL